MIDEVKIKKIYEEIQNKLFYMIPEKWDKLFLYASVIDNPEKDYTGEMFFYYFPKSIIKKNPINVYEVPNRFSIDEAAYLKLAKDLYEKIKFLRQEQITEGEKPWSNVTVSIEDASFKVEYFYDDLESEDVSHYYNHLLWRYNYLGVPIETYPKKEQEVLKNMLIKANLDKKDKKVYMQGIYKEKNKNIAEYHKEDKKEQQEEQEEQKIKSQILNLED